MRDTAELHSVLVYIKDNLISRTDVLEMFRSFGRYFFLIRKNSSVFSMMPKGGNKIWSTADGGLPHMINFRVDDADFIPLSDQSEYEMAVIEYSHFLTIFYRWPKKNF